MKRWGLLVAGLYVVCLMALSFPLFALAFKGDEGTFRHTAQRILRDGPMWGIFLTLGLCQFLFLALPVARGTGRPAGRMPLWITVAVGALALAFLGVALYTTVVEMVLHRLPGAADPWYSIRIPLVLGLGSWLAWFIIFLRPARNAPLGEKPLVRALLAGSILELLVAVPAHLIVRQRDYCCAGLWTFIGLTTGVAVALLAFGPGVLALLVRRVRQTGGRPIAPSRDSN